MFCFVFYHNYKEEKIKCNPLRWVKPSHRVKVGLRREGKIRKTKVDKLVFYLFIGGSPVWPAKHNISITLSGICPSVRQVVVVTLTYILGDTTVCVKSLWDFFLN